MEKFGKILGYLNGVAVHSNQNSDSSQESYVGEFYAGIKWECVEFARRYYLKKYKLTFPEIKSAYELLKLDYFFDIETQKLVRGSLSKPGEIPEKEGLIVVFPANGELKHGHVAILKKTTVQSLFLVEQNIKNKKFKFSTSRISKETFLKSGARFITASSYP
jgi:glutathionylspermidine amidase/synthetase